MASLKNLKTMWPNNSGQVVVLRHEPGKAGLGVMQAAASWVKDLGSHTLSETMGVCFPTQQGHRIVRLERGKSGRPFRKTLHETIPSRELRICDCGVAAMKTAN